MQQIKLKYMQSINLQGVIDSKGLDQKELAKRLFPEHKHPEMALSRVLKGEGQLDTNQISLLASLTSTPIAELFTGAHWSASCEGRTHTLISGDFKAIINLDTHVTKIFHNDSLFHEDLLHSDMIPISTLISMIDALIADYIAKNN